MNFIMCSYDIFVLNDIFKLPKTASLLGILHGFIVAVIAVTLFLCQEKHSCCMLI